MSFDKFAYQKQLHGVKMNPNYYRVLITLGDYATGATGGDAYPGLERLASGACVSKSTVQRALRYLEDEGWIRRHVSADGRVSRGGRRPRWRPLGDEIRAGPAGYRGTSTGQP